jgi:predicted AlkP superfamily phosphohydrolase/phosphomutase
MVVLDGLDYEFISQNITRFTFFATLFYEKRLSRMESVVPADSIPAWITLYTGLNPAEHGIIESINYLDYKRKAEGDYSVIKGKAIWDALSSQGKKVFVFNPFLAYPAWDVHGIMISGPVFESGGASTNRPDLVDLAALPPLGGLVDHPTPKVMRQFLERNLELTQKQFDSFHRYFRSDVFDFAFLGILTADRIQHFLWRYMDQKKHFPDRKNDLNDAIFKTYLLLEKNVQQLFKDYGDEYNIVVISDHGHGRRCQKTFYVNQWLINEGFIPPVSRKKRAIEYAKHAALLAFEKMHCVEAGIRFLKNFRFAHKVKNADYVFKAKGKVYAPNFDGTNPFGGIHVYREACSSNEEYEDIRQRVAAGLMNVQDAGRPVMLWARQREDIYRGLKADSYPEIVFCLDQDYGVDRGLFGNRLFGSNSLREIISGGHRPGGVIMGNMDGIESVGSLINIHDFIMSMN